MYIQKLTDGASKTLKSSSLAFYAVHAALMRVSNLVKRTIMWNVLTLAGLLPVRYSGGGTGEEHEKGLTDRLSMCGFSSFPLMPFRTQCVQNRPVQLVEKERLCGKMVCDCSRGLCAESVQKGFNVVDVSSKKCRWIPAFVSYWCDIPDVQ